jgi:two-component system, NtrC family, response regulator AtoC
MSDSLLLIDDDAEILRIIGAFFEQRGWDVFGELTGEAGLEMFNRAMPEVVIVDLHLPGMDGLEVLEHLNGRDTAVIVLTGDNDVRTAVQAMQLGAENFLVKPVDLNHLIVAVERSAEKVRLRRVNRTLIGQSAASDGLDSLGTSPLMREFARQTALLARSDRTAVLIQGEAGSGKRWVGRLIHDVSNRSSEPFIEVACSASDPAWLEAELFGRDEKQGAGEGDHRRQGLLEIADGGTLFLDEVTDLPLELQAKLLAVLETRAFRRAGGVREIPVDLRVVAATARAPQAAIEAGMLRQDLFYLLNVLPLTVPPLRERSKDDLMALIRAFLRDLTPSMAGSPSRLTDEALDRLLHHGWPGNVRELRNVLERALLLARGQGKVGAEHLPPEFRSHRGSVDRRHLPLTMEELERMHLERTLKHHAGNRTRSAQELGISRATLIAKIKRYGITQ